MLRVENVDSFYGRSHILFEVSLDVKAGETVAILGRNGSGRTTTLKTIMGLITPSSGRVFLEGEDITGWSTYRIAKKGVSFVPEERRVFTTLTVRDNLEVAEKVGRKGYWTRDRVLDLFRPLQKLLHRKGGHLSGGEQQMVAVARGIIQNPKLLILDEPTEGLAPAIVHDIVAMIRTIKEQGDTAILLVEQDVRTTLTVADRVLVLDNGRVVFRGTPRELDGRDDIKKHHMGV
ncbi:MAG: ABC transporter ATP-binding protein [Deltaproteobacteria bacterium]|nr:MAG: ABC transporter ATP-binding protein [Deltaproteobacteria bacterium]